MWTDTTRAQHGRTGLRLPSDLTDGEWALLEPLLPSRKKLGRPPKWTYREIVNGMLFILRAGLPWRMMPRRDFPPMTTIQHYFYAWRDSGLWKTLNHTLLMAAREAMGREASPTAGVIDSQSVKTTESGGVSGYDAGKKTKGRKRHIITDTNGFLVGAVVHAADIQDWTAQCRFSRRSGTPSPGCAMCLPTAAMQAANSARHSRGLVTGQSKSSSDPIQPRALKSSPGDGS